MGRPNPALSLAAFRALAPLIPTEAVEAAHAAWVRGRPLEAGRIMKASGMQPGHELATLRSLSVTLLPD